RIRSLPFADKWHDAAVQFLCLLLALRRRPHHWLCPCVDSSALQNRRNEFRYFRFPARAAARMSTIVLSAGGTGGHLFPAQALAGELLRRGRQIVVMTDSRGRHYETVFPGANIEQVPSAAFVGSLFSRAMAPFRVLPRISGSFFKPR